MSTPPQPTARPDHPGTLAWPVAAVDLPVSVTDLATQCADLEAKFGPGLTMCQYGTHLVLSTPGAHCECATCVHATANRIGELIERPTHSMSVGMVVCTTCGNKRCPAAHHHDYMCTGSNEPGQQPALIPGRRDPRTP